MTDIDTAIARVLELEAEATAGPWESCSWGDTVNGVAAWEVYADSIDQRTVALTAHSPGRVVHDAVLIAEYRTIAPLLARECQRLRLTLRSCHTALTIMRLGAPAIDKEHIDRVLLEIETHD